MRFIQSKRDVARRCDRGQECAGPELTQRVFNDDNHIQLFNLPRPSRSLLLLSTPPPPPPLRRRRAVALSVHLIHSLHLL